jgi:hypothetical protein
VDGNSQISYSAYRFSPFLVVLLHGVKFLPTNRTNGDCSIGPRIFLVCHECFAHESVKIVCVTRKPVFQVNFCFGTSAKMFNTLNHLRVQLV